MSAWTEAIQSCKNVPLHGPDTLIDRWLEQALNNDVSIAWINQLIFTLNMIDSRNLEWIDCVKAAVQATGV